MKKILFLLLPALTLFYCNIAHAENIHDSYDALLKAYVTDGMVDYKSIKENRSTLDNYLSNMAKINEKEFNSWSKDERLAYLINLYNAQTLKLIIDNYPLESIKDLGSLFKTPWEEKFIPLLGKTISLDNIEHDIIRKEYNEPRIHLALVCAAFSCPPLRSEAYVGEKLSSQLDNQGYAFFASPTGLQVDHEKKRVSLSSILKWYKEDFESVEKFAQKYSKENFSNYKISWLKYDWKLNEKK